jgi:hypothetical protein
MTTFSARHTCGQCRCSCIRVEVANSVLNEARVPLSVFKLGGCAETSYRYVSLLDLLLNSNECGCIRVAAVFVQSTERSTSPRTHLAVHAEKTHVETSLRNAQLVSPCLPCLDPKSQQNRKKRVTAIFFSLPPGFFAISRGLTHKEG